MALPKKILVPVDFEPQSRVALDEALELALALDARVEVLHVWHGDRPPQTSAERTIARPLESRDAAASVLGEMVDHARRTIGDRADGMLVEGDAERWIVQRAVDGGFGLVVMGTHGRTGRLHSLIGSVTEGVVRRAPCPVMVVRTP